MSLSLSIGAITSGGYTNNRLLKSAVAVIAGPQQSTLSRCTS